VDPAIVAIVLFAALLHVTWNVLLKTAGDPMAAATVGIVAATLVMAPVAAVGWLAAGRPSVPPEAIALGVVSGLLETGYFVFLSTAYRHGDLSVVYPTARGTAPMLAVLIGVVVFGERLGAPGAVGVGLLLAGLLILTRPWRLLFGDLEGTDRAATTYAIATGVLIALYSSVDRQGARLTEPWIYAALIWPAMAVGLVGWRWLRVASRVRALVPALARGLAGPDAVVVAEPAGQGGGGGGSTPIDPRRPGTPVSGAGALAPSTDTRRAVIGGLITLAAYLLILFAYTRAPLTAVAPLRESAVVVASGWGAFRLGEAEGRRDAGRRLLAAALVAAGIVLLVFEG
jgi:multidrug transporter EmrE-like cation transporter